MWRPRSAAEPVATSPAQLRQLGYEKEVLVLHYRRADLPAGLRLVGPAVVEQLDSTTVIPPGVDAEVDEYLNILMHL